METSITSETISQQTICGDPEPIEIANDTDPKLDQSKDQMGIEQTQINLKNAREIYFQYLLSQKMAHTKAMVRRRAEVGAKTIPNPWPSMAEVGAKTIPTPQPSMTEAGKVPPYGKTMKKIKKGTSMRQ